LAVGFAAAIAILSSAGASWSQSTYWQVTTGSWSASSNWTNGMPLSSGTAYIDNGGTATITSNATCGGLYVGYNGRTAGAGAIVMTGGSLSIPLTYDYEGVGYEGTGTLTQSGGTNANSGELDLGYGPAASGTYTLSGASMLSTDGLLVGDGCGAHRRAGTFDAGAAGGWGDRTVGLRLAAEELEEEVVTERWGQRNTFSCPLIFLSSSPDLQA